jgi:transposase
LNRIEGPFKVCFEASLGYGWLYDQLSRRAAGVVVAHPGQVRLIFRAKRKNDRIDAKKLAKLLYLDAVPPVYVPAVGVRAWRRLIEYRQRQIGARTRTKNQIRALLRSYAIQAPRRLWNRRGLEWLKTVMFPAGEARLERDLLIETLNHLNDVVSRVEKELGRRAVRHPGVSLLMTIPGVGMRTAEAVVAYVDNPRRFTRNKAAGSYFGLVPCQHASGSQNRLGHITQQGPATVRRLLGEASWQAVRRSPEIRAYYERIAKGDPDRKKIAIVATAHYLARMMLAMLQTGEVCRFSTA